VLLRGDVLGLRDYDLINFLEQSGSFLSQIKIASISNEDLLADARVSQLFLHADFGNPFPRETMLADIRECKNNQEYSEFINKRLERLKSVTYIYMNTWGELFCKTFSGLNSMARCLNELVSRTDLKRLEKPNFLKVFLPTGRKELLDLPWLNNYVILSLKTKATAHSPSTTTLTTASSEQAEQVELT
jgi:adenylate cyclase